MRTSGEPSTLASSADAGDKAPAAPAPLAALRISPARLHVVLLLALASGLLVALHLYMSRHMTAPIMYGDELGYLANARVIAGIGEVPQMQSPFYHFGYSLFLIPLYWIHEDPLDIYHAAHTVNAILAAMQLPLLYWLGRSLFALKRVDAALAAAAACLYPAFLVESSLAWTETLAPLVFTAWVAMALCVEQRRSVASLMGFGALAAFTYTVHPRFLVLLPISLGFLAWLRWEGKLKTRPLIAAFVAMALVVFLTDVVNHQLNDAIRGWTDDRETLRKMSLFELITTRFAQPLLPKTLAGQTWYVLTVTAGLAVPALAVLWNRHRGGANQDGSGLTAPCATAGLALAGILGLAATSALYLARATRIDHYFYGRYNEAFFGVLLLAACAGLLQRDWRGRVLLQLAIAVAAIWILAPGTLFEIPMKDPNHLTMTLTIIGLIAFLPDYVMSGSNQLFLPTTAAMWGSALAGALGLAILVHGRLAVLMLGFLFVFAGLSLEERLLQPYSRWSSRLLTLHETVRKLQPKGDIAYDRSHSSIFGRNGYQFYLPNHRFLFFRSATEDPPARLIFSTNVQNEVETLVDRAQRIGVDLKVNQALWRLKSPVPDDGGD